MAALSKMKKLDKKKKPKQKQKQKQTVRTSVKVNVQSSGGSGGGGVSQGGGMPSYIPNAFNQEKLVGLLEQISQKVAVRQNVPVPTGMPISQPIEPPVENPANDDTTLKAVFNSPINFDIPLEVGGVSKLEKPLVNLSKEFTKGEKKILRTAEEELTQYGNIILGHYTKDQQDFLLNNLPNADFIIGAPRQSKGRPIGKIEAQGK